MVPGSIHSIKGFQDILPDESPRWQAIEEAARRTFRQFGFSEIRIPVLERTELFTHSIGETTDIVEKQMYTFEDKKGESCTLRPEGTASVIRAVIEHGLLDRAPVLRLYYLGPMFRYERPQKGRLRQFHQIGVEMLGAESPRSDAEIILLLVRLIEEAGIPDGRLELNSLGDETCRPRFRRALLDYVEANRKSFCDDCTRRAATNPLRILDCKKEKCVALAEKAPSIQEHLCPACRAHFDAVKEALSAVSVPFRVNPRIVRGLDYYNRTAFEVVSERLGAQNAIGAGGRYNGLVRSLGGPDAPGTGFAIGLERLFLLAEASAAPVPPTDLFIAALGEEARVKAFGLADRVRMRGISVIVDDDAKSLKALMKRADRLGVRYVYILGDEELARGKGILRNMRAKEPQREIEPDRLADALVRATET